MGRPCMIAEREYDTPVPAESPNEAAELWTSHAPLPREHAAHLYTPTNSHTISCFAAATRLCECECR